MILFALALAAVDLDKEVARVEAAFDHYQFAVARDGAKALLEAGTLDEARANEMRRVHAFSSFFLNDKVQAERSLRQVFAAHPDATIDPGFFPPPLVDFFYDVKKKVEAEKSKATPPPPPTPSVSASPPRFRPVQLLPLGIGQLAQGDVGAGVAFLVVEAALLGGNIGLYVALKDNQKPTGFYRSPPTARALQVGADVAGTGLIAVAVFSLVDSIFLSPRRVAASSATTIGVVPLAGLGLAAAGTF